MLQQLNSPFLYLVCGLIILFVAAVCVIFLVRAYRAGKAIGMDEKKLKRAVTSSMTFSVLPSIGILLGVIALSGSLGTPWPCSGRSGRNRETLGGDDDAAGVCDHRTSYEHLHHVGNGFDAVLQ